MQKVRWLFQARKAGHTGTLDPFATGMLPICLGEASKTAAFMLDASKTYEARARLGQATDTGDIEGAVVREEAVPALEASDIEAAMAAFRGPIEQASRCTSWPGKGARSSAPRARSLSTAWN